MTEIVLYVASSLDGYIAGPKGEIDWLTPFEDVDYGFEKFHDGIGTLLMGRATFDLSLTFPKWPHPGKRTLVLTNRPAPTMPPGVELVVGDVRAIAAGAKDGITGDVWLVGGGNVTRQFLDAGLIDRLDLFFVPIVLGEGLPLFPTGKSRSAFRLETTQTFAKGLVRLRYRRAV